MFWAGENKEHRKSADFFAEKVNLVELFAEKSAVDKSSLEEMWKTWTNEPFCVGVLYKKVFKRKKEQRDQDLTEKIS